MVPRPMGYNGITCWTATAMDIWPLGALGATAATPENEPAPSHYTDSDSEAEDVSRGDTPHDMMMTPHVDDQRDVGSTWCTNTVPIVVWGTARPDWV